jgi:hypothetical protein
MIKIPKPYLIDAIRLLRNTVDETEFQYREWLREKASIYMSYRPAMSVVRPVYSGDISLQMALTTVDNAPEKWRSPNREVIPLIHSHAAICREEAGNLLTCLDVKSRYFSVRSDIRFSVSPSLIYVSQKRPVIHWLQPRKKFGLSEKQIPFLMAITKYLFVDDEYYECPEPNIEIHDLSFCEKSKKRVSRIFCTSDFNLPSMEEIEYLFAIFVLAHDRIATDWVPPAPAEKPRRKPEGDDRQQTLIF